MIDPVARFCSGFEPVSQRAARVGPIKPWLQSRSCNARHGLFQRRSREFGAWTHQRARADGVGESPRTGPGRTVRSSGSGAKDHLQALLLRELAKREYWVFQRRSAWS